MCLLQGELNHPLDSGNNSVALTLEPRAINNGHGCPTYPTVAAPRGSGFPINPISYLLPTEGCLEYTRVSHVTLGAYLWAAQLSLLLTRLIASSLTAVGG